MKVTDITGLIEQKQQEELSEDFEDLLKKLIYLASEQITLVELIGYLDNMKFELQINSLQSYDEDEED
jgi:nicotinic acid phosphoribosyltransferase